MAHVLIVEDNADLADNLLEILGDDGHVVEWVHSAEEALTRVAQTRYAGILTDLRLPQMSGLEFLETLRTNNDPTPVVLMTAFADDQAAEEAKCLGALEVVWKPLDLDLLFKLIAEFSPSPRCVVVLEDNAQLAENISEALESQGFEALTLRSVQAALDLRRLPRVAVIDLRLPDGDGLSAIRRLLARDPTLSVVLVSGYLDEARPRLEDAPKWLKHVFPKPVQMDLLLQAVSREALEAHR